MLKLQWVAIHAKSQRTLKIYLNLSNCVYVLGMDQRVIERAIASQLEKTKEPVNAAAMAKEYLEKICQDVYHLPVQGSAKRLR